MARVVLIDALNLIRRLYAVQGAQGQQFEGPGARSYQTDLAHRTLLVLLPRPQAWAI